MCFIYAGMLIATSLFVIKLFKLLYLIEKNPKRWHGDILLIKLLKSTAAFSFFNRVFIGDAINETERNTILQHEMVHVNHKHSIDLLFFEVLRIVMWFNPLIYLYQSRITALHEYIADAEASKNQDKQLYYQNLLAQVFDTNKISFINPFYKQSLIKKRIIMLSKSKSKQLHLIKYALLIPMVIAMLMYTSSQAQEIKPVASEEVENLSDEEMINKYYQELELLQSKGVQPLEISRAYTGKMDEYLLSKEDFYRQAAYFKFISNVIRKRDDSLKKVDANHKSLPFKEDDAYKNYESYLKYKSTDEARKKWDEMNKRNSLMVIPNDMKSLTDSERSEILDKLNDIKKNSSWRSLVVRNAENTLSYKVTADNYDFLGKVLQDQILDDAINKMSNNVTNVTEIPYAIVERVPAFEGCETLPTNQQIKECTTQSMSQFVNKNFDISIAEKAGLKGRQRIAVVFKIADDGNIIDVKARASHPDLEAEAKRVIESIPRLTPGQQKGENITVQFSLPIIFQIQ
jgi:bla regulator protein blaR1